MTTTKDLSPYVIGPGTPYRIWASWSPQSVPPGCYAIVRDDCGPTPVGVDGANLYRSAREAEGNMRLLGAD
jgi:hypothetical protein